MKSIKELWSNRILKTLSQMADEADISSRDFADRLTVGRPPRNDMGDLSFPLFSFARDFRKPAPILAHELATALGAKDAGIRTAGPYINIHIDRSSAIAHLFSAIDSAGDEWGAGEELCGRRIMIEFSSPNTNKPLHLGHLRNDILGESCARIMKARGAEVLKVNLVNDRGIHICKSMLAYRKFAHSQTPESLGVKSDRFVGDLYVQFSNWAKKEKGAEAEAQKMLQDWETGDKDVRKLWAMMNEWVLSGIEATYRRTGVSFDRVYKESEIYLTGKDQVLRGLSRGVFIEDEDGSICLDMSDIGLDTKVLLRSDGTSLYITQDLGTAISRHEQWPFDQLIYVVGNEQEYHFKVLFYALKKLGFSWADHLEHLSYGMVNLSEGKMKSREGRVVDADELIDQLTDLALAEIRKKGREDMLDDAKATAEKIAIAALHYFLLHVSPGKDMIFNPEESLSFTGNTGPYLQYVVARVVGLMEREPAIVRSAKIEPELLDREDEWELSRGISEFPELVSRTAAKLDPSILTTGLYEIARDFSSYYHEVPIARAEPPELAASRMALARAVLVTLKRGFGLLNIPYIESM